MNKAQAKQIASKILSGLFTKAKKSGVEAATISKVSGKAKTLGAVSKLAKYLEPLLIVNVVDQAIGSIPIVKELWAGIGQIDDFIMDNTVYRIPGVGDVVKRIQKTTLNTLLPNTQKYAGNNRINDPKYYENTDMHQAWNIPFNFPDTDYLDYAGGVTYGSIAVVNLISNYLADEYAIKARTTQIFDLLKGIRGLSGKQPYSTGDLYYYRRNTEYVINEYCRLKFALRLSQVYILTKSRMPINLLTELGWDAEDFIKNRALYVSALTDLGNFITNNVPAFGTQLKRIYGLWEHLIPDSNDKKVSLFYKVNIHYHNVIPQSNNTFTEYGDCFIKGNGIAGGMQGFTIDGLRASTIQYNTYVSNMLAYIDDLNSNDQFNPIRADIIASFGVSAIWTDKQINQVVDTKYDDLIGPYDELFLSQIQNGTLLDMVGQDLVTGVGWIPTSHNGIRQEVNLGSMQADGSYTFPYSVTGNNGIISVDFKAQNLSGSAGYIVMPGNDGVAEINTSSASFTDSTIVIANKYNMKESEQIELVQLMSFAIAKYAGYDSVGSDTMIVDYITNTFALESIRVIYFDPGTKTDQVIPLRHAYLAIGSLASSFNMLDDYLKSAQFWSQADYGVKLNCSLLDLGSQRSSSYLMLDFNIMGSISKSAFKQEIRYAAYSLYAADVKITEAKKLNNIVGVYNMK